MAQRIDSRLRDAVNLAEGLARRNCGNTVAARIRRGAAFTRITPGDWAKSRWKRDRNARPGGKRPRRRSS